MNKGVFQHANSIVVQAKKNPHKYTLFWMHGLGDRADSFYRMFQMYNLQPPHTKVIFLNAPMVPVSLNQNMVMPSWFDINLHPINGKLYSFP